MTPTAPLPAAAAPVRPAPVRSVPAGGWRRTLVIGWRLGRLQLTEFTRNRSALWFGLLFPVLLLVLLSTIFNETIEGTHTSLAQYMTAGVLAISAATAGFSNLAISLAMQRDSGRIKRFSAAPMSGSAFLLGQFVRTAAIGLAGTLILLVIGVVAYDIDLPTDPTRIAMFAFVWLTGVASCSLLGIAVSRLCRDGENAPAIVTPPFLVLQFISGTFLDFSSEPGWLKAFASVFPLRWMALGFRSALLPDSFAAQETGGAWQRPMVVAVLLAWTVGGALLARATFRWRESG